MTINFVIPMEREDLLKADSLDQYAVLKILNVRELKPRMKEIEFDIRNDGSCFGQKDWFDSFYSVIFRFHEELPTNIKATAHDCLLNAGDQLLQRVDSILNEQDPDPEAKLECLNDMKMIVYLITQLTELIERETVEKSSQISAASLPGKGRKKNSTSGYDWAGMNWESSRMSAINFMYKILQLNVNRLFTPPVAEEDFINCIANAGFRILENPVMAHQRNRSVRMSVIQVLSSLNSRFDYSLSCSFKLVQELKLFEHMVSPLAEAVEVFVKEFNCKSIVMEIIQEISRLDMKELNRDTSATRSYSLFLFELTEKTPRVCKTFINILGILGEIVIKVLSKEDLDEKSKDNRNQFLEYLEDHIHDINAHVRSSVLSIWSKLCVAKSIPLGRQYSVLKLTMGRLLDKSSNVRKQAVQLLTSLLQCNPYTFSLPIEELESQLNAESKKLQDLEGLIDKEQKKWDNEDIELHLKEILESDDYGKENLPKEIVWDGAVHGEVSRRIKHLITRKTYINALLMDARIKFPDEFSAESETISSLKDIYFSASMYDQTDEEALTKQRIIIAYLKDSVSFGKLMNDSLPIMCQLLGSKQSTDILEAIDFFVTAFEFGILNAMMGVRKMLSLIWSNESVVKEAVVKAYRRLYIDVGTRSGGTSQIVKNIIALVRGSTLGECTSLEALVGMLVETKDIGKECFQILWQIFTLVMPDSNEESSCDAIMILGMIGLKEPSVVSSNVSIIIEHAFGERGLNNFQLVCEACKSLLKIVPRHKSDDLETPFRYDSDDKLFESLHKIIVEGITRCESQNYIPMVKVAVTVIYEFSEHPDRRMAQIALDLICAVCDDNNINMTEIKRLVYVAGQIAVCQIKHLDISIFCEMKRRNHLREMKKEKKRKRKSVANIPNSASETPRNGNNDDDELVGAEGDDAETEFIRNICENETVTGGNLLSHFVPFIVSLCSSQEHDDSLKTVAVLTLSKFMLVSNEFCDQHLRLFFTLLEKSKNETTRANMIIAAGDLSVRFPNTLEPWTPRMYARLRDESSLVRSNTLTVLTHLILNDMIKVKGQISDMALCIIDKVDRISSMAKLFFTELARKGNSLYNVMPDIVSRLSSPEVGVPEEEFREIMKFIICLIEKDKHLESLVEKMCHRFRVTKTDRQWRDLSYCLCSFSFNDKAVKKLSDNFNCYSDKLYIQDVYDSLTSILVLAKKTVKNETKVIIEELEGKIEEAHERGLEDHTANERANKAKAGKANEELDEEEFNDATPLNNTDHSPGVNGIRSNNKENVHCSPTVSSNMLSNEMRSSRRRRNNGQDNEHERVISTPRNSVKHKKIAGLLDSDDEVSFHPRSLPKVRVTKNDEETANKNRRKTVNYDPSLTPGVFTKFKEFKSLRNKRLTDKNTKDSSDDSEEDNNQSSSSIPNKKKSSIIRTNSSKRKSVNKSFDNGSSEEEFSKKSSPIEELSSKKETISSVKKISTRSNRLEPPVSEDSPKKSSPEERINAIIKNKIPVLKLTRIESLRNGPYNNKSSPRDSSISRKSPHIETKSLSPSTETFRRSSPRLKREASSSPGIHLKKKGTTKGDTTEQNSTTSSRNKLSRKK
ncbi:YCS4 [Lepeophtheirus salmonis]|uniref:Condensin complex subunit 1 n=1 Tax=Lepeophtheirus salmonis TaxID=72036 RepID=A0A7R8H3R3_LEPSM|nr:YCS4 [Lepeophtheirus salmonis]CAF2849340.1 YCS4 [Lepeophtheirus salmonis]